MNIKDFLIENYIWILVVILLSIVTIIGFLADKKRVKNKKEEVPANNGNNANATTIPDNSNNSNPVNLGINYQTNSNQQFDSLNMPLPQANIDMQPVPPVSPVGPTEPIGPQAPIQNTMPSPIEPVNTSPAPEPMYQPLSEQYPSFKEQTPSVSPMMPSYSNPQPPVSPITGAPVENSGVVEPTNFVNQPNYITPTATQPTPINNQSIQPNMAPNENIYNNQMNNNYQNPQPVPPSQMPYQSQPTNTIPTPIPSPVPVEPTKINTPQQPTPMPNQPVSFVYGPQNNQNNNQNM